MAARDRRSDDEVVGAGAAAGCHPIGAVVC